MSFLKMGPENGAWPHFSNPGAKDAIYSFLFFNLIKSLEIMIFMLEYK